MDANITNLFYIKRAKPNSKGLVPIFQRVTINGQRIEKSTGKYINLELWSAEGTKMKGKTDQMQYQPFSSNVIARHEAIS